MHSKRYLQHPNGISLTIEAVLVQTPSADQMPLGLMLCSSAPFNRGCQLRLSHPELCPDNCIEAVVTACWQQDDGYQLVLDFSSEEQLYRMRLLEQLCHIKLYQTNRELSGERISFETAAQQWISQYAAHFPPDGL